jgi:hypothetical protein
MILKELSKIANKKDRLVFLANAQNKKEILEAKKAMPKETDSIQLKYVFPLESSSSKSPLELAKGEALIIGNACGFIDSHDDVSMKGSWTKTVKERGERVPILKDHNYKVDSMFAKNLGSYILDIPIIDLGFDKLGNTEVLAAKIKPNKEMYDKYSNGIITQHSVGLQYVKLEMAVNNPQDEEGYKQWLAAIDSVINREMAEERGYFFPIYEQKLIEFSAVVFGSNAYTPAYTENKSLSQNEPSKDTQKQNEPKSENRFFTKLISK